MIQYHPNNLPSRFYVNYGICCKTIDWTQIVENMLNAYKLGEFSLDKCFIYDRNMRKIVDLLIGMSEKYPHIKKVSFEYNYIRSVKHLDRLLRNSHIRHVSFNNNRINDTQIDELVILIRKYNVEIVDLFNNELTPKGYTKLSRVFDVLKSANIDNIDNNPQFWRNTCMGIDSLIIGRIIKDDVWNSDIITNSLIHNKRLTKLKIYYTPIPLYNVIEKNKKMTQIEILSSELDDDRQMSNVKCQMANALMNNDTLINFKTFMQFSTETWQILYNNYSLLCFNCSDSYRSRERLINVFKCINLCERNQQILKSVNHYIIQFVSIFVDELHPYIMLDILDYLSIVIDFNNIFSTNIAGSTNIPLYRFNDLKKNRLIENTITSIRKIRSNDLKLK